MGRPSGPRLRPAGGCAAPRAARHGPPPHRRERLETRGGNCAPVGGAGAEHAAAGTRPGKVPLPARESVPHFLRHARRLLVCRHQPEQRRRLPPPLLPRLRGPPSPSRSVTGISATSPPASSRTPPVSPTNAFSSYTSSPGEPRRHPRMGPHRLPAHAGELHGRAFASRRREPIPPRAQGGGGRRACLAAASTPWTRLIFASVFPPSGFSAGKNMFRSTAAWSYPERRGDLPLPPPEAADGDSGSSARAAAGRRFSRLAQTPARRLQPPHRLEGRRPRHPHMIKEMGTTSGDSPRPFQHRHRPARDGRLPRADRPLGLALQTPRHLPRHPPPGHHYRARLGRSSTRAASWRRWRNFHGVGRPGNHHHEARHPGETDHPPRGLHLAQHRHLLPAVAPLAFFLPPWPPIWTLVLTTARRRRPAPHLHSTTWIRLLLFFGGVGGVWFSSGESSSPSMARSSSSLCW